MRHAQQSYFQSVQWTLFVVCIYFIYMNYTHDIECHFEYCKIKQLNKLLNRKKYYLIWFAIILREKFWVNILFYLDRILQIIKHPQTHYNRSNVILVIQMFCSYSNGKFRIKMKSETRRFYHLFLKLNKQFCICSFPWV